MSDERIHRAISADGTEIAGRVHGQGPPLVLVHGGLGDGEKSWRFLLPHLSTRFTCYAMSMRGRGLSADSADRSAARLEQDVVAFADSVGEPVGLVGHSSGATFTLGAAARAAQVTAVALYEPALVQLSEELGARFRKAFARVRQEAADNPLTEAVQVFIEDVALANDEELATLAETGSAPLLAPNVPSAVRDDWDSFLVYRPVEAARARLTRPALLMYGSRTHDAYREAIMTLAGQLADPRLREVPGAGHMGPLLAAEKVNETLTHFLTEVWPPA